MSDEMTRFVRHAAATPSSSPDLERIQRDGFRRRRRKRYVQGGAAVGLGLVLVAGVVLGVAELRGPSDPLVITSPDDRVSEGGLDCPAAVEEVADGPVEAVLESGRATLYVDREQLLVCVDHPQGGSSVATVPIPATHDDLAGDVISVDHAGGSRTTYLEGPLEGRSFAYTTAAGRVGGEVEQVVVVRRDGSEVTAGVEDGYWLAWWEPDSPPAETVRAYDTDGVLLTERPAR